MRTILVTRPYPKTVTAHALRSRTNEGGKMITASERVFRPSRVPISVVRRVAVGMAVALAGLSIATGSAFAASNGNDGTSNTIQFGVTAHGTAGVNARLIEEDGIYPPFA